MFAQPEENKRQKEMRGTSIITLSEIIMVLMVMIDYDGGDGNDVDDFDVLHVQTNIMYDSSSIICQR